MSAPRPGRVRFSGGRLRFRWLRGPGPGLGDAYHFLITIRWRWLLLMSAVSWAGINAIFACLYLAGGDCFGGGAGFLEAFSFSVQTISTIGYGALAPTTPYAHALVAIESWVGLLVVALTTGLVFARFARPTARVEWSRVSVVGQVDGRRCLQARVANLRDNAIVDARVRAVAVIERFADGAVQRDMLPLALARHENLLFAGLWTITHVIDRASPLARLGEGRELLGVLVTLTGIDDALASTVSARGWYEPDAVRFGARFADMIGGDEEGMITIDYRRLHETVPSDEG